MKKRNKKGQFVPVETKDEQNDKLIREAIFQLYLYKAEIELESIIGIDQHGTYFKSHKRAAP